MPNSYSLIEVAKLESAITGVFAGFALTIVVLLIERLASRSSDIEYDSGLGKAAITIFVAAFFTSTLASFLFAVSGGEIEISPRLFLLIMVPSFAFVTSAILLALGLVFVLGAYKLSYALGPALAILYVTVLISLIHYAYSAADVMAIMVKTSTTTLLSQHQVLLPLLAAPVASLIAGLSLKWRLHQTNRRHFDPQWFHVFIYSCIATNTIVAIITPFITVAPVDVFVPPWQVFLFVVGLSILAGWSIVYIPKITKD
jgi:hypothetical protein